MFLITTKKPQILALTKEKVKPVSVRKRSFVDNCWELFCAEYHPSNYVILCSTPVQKRSLLFSSATTVMDNLYFLTFISPQNNHSILLKLLKKPFMLWQTPRIRNNNLNNNFKNAKTNKQTNPNQNEQKIPQKYLQPSRNKLGSKWVIIMGIYPYFFFVNTNLYFN